jgi:hypothetical protein
MVIVPSICSISVVIGDHSVEIYGIYLTHI